MKKIFIALLTAILVFALCFDTFAEDGIKAQEVKIALIGDTDVGSNFRSVLKMVALEKPNLLMINGDLGYKATPAAWKKRVISSVDINKLPIIATLGNHDLASATTKYIEIINGFRTTSNGLKTVCTGKTPIVEDQDITAVDEVCTLGNVSVIGSAIGQVLTTTYLENRLATKLEAVPEGNWKLVGYHFTLASMNVGTKADQATHEFFDIIRKSGAIGAQAHTHFATATCPISSVFEKNAPIVCHPTFTNPDERFVMSGTGIFVDSSLGGKSTRPRIRCKAANESGCAHMVDIISKEAYTRTDGLKKTNFNRFGALFIVFNVGGDPKKAKAYFKSIDTKVVFSFNISR